MIYIKSIRISENYQIPEQPPSFLRNTRRYVYKVLDLSAEILIIYPLGLYLDDFVLKTLDFFIINDNQKYYTFNLSAENEFEKYNEFDSYSENTKYDINQVYYRFGTDVIISEKLFRQSKSEIKKLLNSAFNNINVLTEEQKKVECKVLINTTETRTMTLEQVFEFENDLYLKEEDCKNKPDYEEHKEPKTINVENIKDFQILLSYLYTCYRKIELKLQSNGHSLTSIERKQNLTVAKYLENLQKAKAEFKETNKNDFMRMYPIMKNLFYKYLDYLKFFMDHRLDMDEGNDLPVNWEEFKLWLKKLNDWEPIKMVYPSTNKFSMTFISSIENYKNVTLEIDDTITEPMITVKKQHNKLFGIIKIRNPEATDENSATATIMAVKCPMKCSEDVRIWFCYVCGEIVKNYGVFTVCRCGQEILNRNEMVCNHPKHQQDVLIKELPSDLRSIVYQLKKYEGEHVELKNAVETIIDKSNEDDLMKETIQGIRSLTIQLDGDTRNLIDEYLKAR